MKKNSIYRGRNKSKGTRNDIDRIDLGYCIEIHVSIFLINKSIMLVFYKKEIYYNICFLVGKCTKFLRLLYVFKGTLVSYI